MATMEKKHLTYACRTIRPNGGVDITVSQLRKEAREVSMSGFLAADPADAVACYRRAERRGHEATERKTAMQNWLRQEEIARQQAETKMLNRSLGIRIHKFQDEWAEKRSEMEETCKHLLDSVQESAEAARLHLERQLERERVPKVKYRPMTRDGIYHAKILSEAGMFDQVITLHNRLQDGKKKEEEDWEKATLLRQTKRREELERKLEEEIDNMEEKVARIRGAFEKKMVKAKDEVMQNCKNLTLDMEAAFKREWFARPEVATSAKKSRKSRIKTCATFMGSITQERAIGGKHDLPSVSRLHFEDQETEGTSRDLPIVRRLDVTDYSPRSKSSPRSALSLPNIRSPGSILNGSLNSPGSRARSPGSGTIKPMVTDTMASLADTSLESEDGATEHPIKEI